MKLLAAAVLVASTTGCVESVNQGYGYNGGGNGYGGGSGYASGYSNGYYPSGSGYYSQPPRVNNYYYNPQPQVVTQTRYVPAPVPSRQADRSDDHRWGGRDNDNQQPQHHQAHPDRKKERKEMKKKEKGKKKRKKNSISSLKIISVK